MSPDRVIQDSDDEVDSLPGDPGPLSPAPEPVQPADSTINEPTHNSTINHDEPQTSNLGIDFDQFIQSNDTAQIQESSSQQRREERWIPSSGAAGGSIGESWRLLLV